MKPFILLFVIFEAFSANAADIYIRSFTAIHIVGPIVKGDAEKFAIQVSRSHKASSISVKKVELASLGGDLNEALRLASLIDGLKLRAVVSKGELCVSACFFLYLAGYQRMAWHVPVDGRLPVEDERKRKHVGQIFGYVGVHRPYYGTDQETFSTSIAKQENLMMKVRTYLREKGVHQTLIDEMMARPSNDVYWLKEKDLEMVGTYSPGIEEILIKRCGYRRTSYVVDNNWSVERRDALNQCTYAVEEYELSPQREKYLAALSSGWRP